MRKTFQERLDRCLRDGAMTVSDMARWFGRPYQTVYKWHLEGNIPWGPAGVLAHENLRRLETEIRRGKHFPIPRHLMPRERVAYMEEIVNDVAGRVSREGAA